MAAARIAALEEDVERLRRERAADADDIAAMLVRVANAEREKAAVDQRALVLAASVRELEARLDEDSSSEPARMAALLGELERAQTRNGELEAQLRRRARWPTVETPMSSSCSRTTGLSARAWPRRGRRWRS
jgi:hypothetical protein